jgi:hypothetical protein
MPTHSSRSFFALLVGVLALSVSASEPISHSVQWLLFEIVEDGVVTNKRAALDIYASQSVNGKPWAEARVAVLTIDHAKRRVELDPFYCSTDRGTIRDLRIDDDVLSFEMMPFPLSPDRPIRIVASREGKSSIYRVSGAGIWSNFFTKNPMTIEWKQVSSIELPYRTIGR